MPASRRAQIRRPVTLLLAFAMIAVAVPAAAQPSSDEVRGRLDRAQQALDEIEEEVSLAVEEYHEANEALEAVEDEAAQARDELASLSSQADRATESVVDHARRLHKFGPALELSTVLVASDPTEAGARTAVLRRILAGQQADLEDLGALIAAVRAAEQRLAVAVAEAERRQVEVEERRQELEATLDAREQDVARLQGELQQAIEREERARRLAEQRRREEERRRQAAERARQQARAEQVSASAPATRRSAQVAVDTALAQIGKPYRWGGNGPNAYDCSGLTRFAWRAAGVDLPRSSRAQYAATTRISRGDLQPGDLVFYHSPISHVAMYIGGGKVVEAPYSGNSVRIRHDGLTRRGIVGYGRP